MRFLWCLVLGIWSLGAAAHAGPKEPFEALFHTGAQAYKSGDFLGAAEAFNKSAALHPAAGTLQNLGNAEWQRGQPGTAIVAWERSAWLDPFNNAARDDLRFARKNAQVEAPELAWYEVVSTWLPSNWWAAIAGASFWGAVGMVMVPGILRIRKAGWHQAVAAFGVMVFLLSLPAHAGIYSRSRIGFVLEKNTPLRLTPTQDAQIVTHLGAAESVRCERQRGNYLLVHNARARGWIERDQCGLVCPK